MPRPRERRGAPSAQRPPAPTFPSLPWRGAGPAEGRKRWEPLRRGRRGWGRCHLLQLTNAPSWGDPGTVPRTPRPRAQSRRRLERALGGSPGATVALAPACEGFPPLPPQAATLLESPHPAPALPPRSRGAVGRGAAQTPGLRSRLRSCPRLPAPLPRHPGAPAPSAPRPPPPRDPRRALRPAGPSRSLRAAARRAVGRVGSARAPG